MPTPDELHNAHARRAAQTDEYGTYVAAEQIFAPSGALAYDVGHPVPVSNVTGDGRVVLDRHVCTPAMLADCDEASYDPDRQQCGRFNAATHHSEPGLVAKRGTKAAAPVTGEEPKRPSKPTRSSGAAEE